MAMVLEKRRKLKRQKKVLPVQGLSYFGVIRNAPYSKVGPGVGDTPRLTGGWRGNALFID